MKKHYNLMSVSMRLIALTMVFYSMGVLTSCSKDDDNSTTTEISFEDEMTAALADAQKYGPQTDAFAREVAAKFDGCVTDINYKTRESATRKCITDNCRPYDLKDLARTTIVAGWDSTEIKPVINYVVTTSTERGFFGRYKHQTSDYGYWGDIVNLKYDKLMTEVQVKTYGMFYAAQPDTIVRSVIGDSLYNYIHDKTGVEPGMSHYYYEIMRADTSSAATVELYKRLSIEYFSHFEHIKDAEPARTYNMSVDASKGANEAVSRANRALSLTGSALSATWATGEHVYVQGKLRSNSSTFWYKGDIQPQTAGTITQLNGTITVPDEWAYTSIQDAIDNYVINYPLEIVLQFPRSGALDYTGQVGTLAGIAAKYDYAIATGVLFDIAGDHIIGTNSANFVNQQAIVKFTLKDKADADGTTLLNPTALTVDYKSASAATMISTDVTYTTNGNGVVYVAIPAYTKAEVEDTDITSSHDVTLTATVGGNTYTYNKTNVTFQNGKYYEITVKMSKQ